MSNLITRPDDERLGNFRVQVPAQDVGLIVASLCASLQREESERAERDAFKANVYTLVESCENAMRQRDRALLRAEKAEAVGKEQAEKIKELESQVCAAREHLDGIEKLIAPEDEDDGLCFVCKQVFADLSSSTPCPHEAKAKRLREAIDWACEHESNGRLVDINMAEFLRRAGGEVKNEGL